MEKVNSTACIDKYIAYCNKLEAKTLLRNLQPQKRKKIIVDFSNNDYLSLSKDISVINASIEHSKKWGTSARASRLLSGNLNIFTELERKIAKAKNTEEALILNSGFIGNSTVIAALLNKQVLKEKPIAFCDKLIHSSMHLGIKIAEATQITYNHLDMGHLESLLKEYKDSPNPKFIFSETIFSMDGDVVDINKIIKLAKEYNAFLYLDEAHDIGVMGKNGYGLTQKYANDIDCILGSFSKAIGCFGGYIACSKQLKQYLVNKCAGLIYSVALPPMVIGAASQAWDELPELDSHRKAIAENADYLRKKLVNLGFDIGNSSTHIIPIILKSEEKVLRLQKYLAENGVLVSAIRPPSVPPNKSLVRISICAEHSASQIDYLIKLLEKLES